MNIKIKSANCNSGWRAVATAIYQHKNGEKEEFRGEASAATQEEAEKTAKQVILNSPRFQAVSGRVN